MQERDARIERLTGSLMFVQAQLDGMTLGKNEIESKLRVREAEIDDLEGQIAAWQSDLQTVLPEAAAPEAIAEEVQPGEAAAVEVQPGEAAAEEAQPAEAPAPEKPEAQRAAKAAALAATLGAVVARSKETDAKLQETAALSR